MDILDFDKLINYIHSEFDIQRQVIARTAYCDKAAASPPVRPGLRKAYKNEAEALSLATLCVSRKGASSLETMKKLQTMYALPKISNSHIDLLRSCFSNDPDNPTETKLMVTVLAQLIKNTASMQDSSSEAHSLSACRQVGESCSLPDECLSSHLKLLNRWDRQSFLERNRRTATIHIDENAGTISRTIETILKYRNPRTAEIGGFLNRAVGRKGRTDAELIESNFRDLHIEIDGKDYADKLETLIDITPRNIKDDSKNDTMMRLLLPIDESKESLEVKVKYTTVSSLSDPHITWRTARPAKEINHNYRVTNDNWEIGLYGFFPFHTIQESLHKDHIEYMYKRAAVQFKKETWSLPGTGYVCLLTKRK